VGEDVSITGDEWASAIEDSGSSADSVSFGDRNISIDDGGSSSSSTSSSSDSGSSSTSSSSSTSNDSYDVPSGYVEAVNRESSGSTDHTDQTDSAQVAAMKDATEGDLDSHSVELTQNKDGSNTLSAESNLGETVSSTVMPTGDGINVPEPPDLSGLSDAAKAALVVLVVLVVAIVGGN
jgi:hypothetical protein